MLDEFYQEIEKEAIYINSLYKARITLDIKTQYGGTSLVVQWLRLCAPNAGGPGLIPGQGTKYCMPQLKIPRATTKTRCSQIN